MTEIIDNKKNELLELRMRVNQSSDEQLEEAMYDEWMHGIIPDAHVSDDALQRIHDQVLGRIKTRKLTTRRVIRYMQIAASFFLPICLVTMLFLYRENQQYASIPMTEITTKMDEQVSITLPDGTVVGMNSMSKLKYAPQDFSDGRREVYFDGEGHYKVTKDKEHPFTIHALGMEITVLGTEFNLINREKDNKAEVALLNGCVKLTSLVSGESYTMSPQEVVIIDKKTGAMDIHRVENIKDATSWQQKQMIFRNAPLEEVFASIGKRYNVNIAFEVRDTALFTGTLPTNNLNEALKIIMLAYGFDISSNDQKNYVVKSVTE